MDSRLEPGSGLIASLEVCEREGERLRQFLGAYQTFVGHDLPNQLVSVQAYARLIEEADLSGLDEESRMFLSRIGVLSRKMGSQARRLSEIDKLLCEPPWGPPVSLGDVAEEAIVGIRCRMDASRISFSSPEVAPTLPLAGALFRQVLDELLANAVAAVGPGRAGRIDVSGEGGMIRVRDTGVGIPPERIARLRATDQIGGLLLVQQAAALWGGRLHIESAVGRGTTMTVTTSATTGGQR